MQKTEIKNELNQTFTTLLEKLSAFDESEFNQKPSPEKWSAAQVAQHLILSGSGISQILTNETETIGRKPDLMVERIKNDLSNLEIQMNAPEFIVPEEKSYQKDELLKKLADVAEEIKQTAEDKDLSKTYQAFEFPVWGYLTGLETLAFVNHHIRRHLQQIDKIRQSI